MSNSALSVPEAKRCYYSGTMRCECCVYYANCRKTPESKLGYSIAMWLIMVLVAGYIPDLNGDAIATVAAATTVAMLRETDAGAMGIIIRSGSGRRRGHHEWESVCMVGLLHCRCYCGQSR